MSEQFKNARQKAWKRQRGQCFYCNATVAKHKATLDHRVPRALGGNCEGGNAVMACRRCNEAKADMPEEIFILGPEARERWLAERRMGQKVSQSPFFDEFRDETPLPAFPMRVDR